MSFLKDLKEVLGIDPDAKTSLSEVSQDNPVFVYIRIPGDLDPEDRTSRYADPLDETLAKESLGVVTGGGSMFGEPDELGDDEVVFCGIDVHLYDAKKGIALLRRELIRLKAPQGTALLYELRGLEFEDPVYQN